MMTLLMGVREPNALARACDLGIAMQLTNIARDVGEDARRGRIYLPLDWLKDVDVEAWLERPAPVPEIKRVVRRLLDEADALYRRADRGIAMLPRECKVAIRAARLVYSDIGRTIARADYDSVTRRAVVPRSRKLWLLLRASAAPWPTARPIDEPPLRAAEALVAAAREGATKARGGDRERLTERGAATSVASADELGAITRGLRHIYHGDTVDRVSRYAVRKGALPPDLTGRVLFTVFPYEAVFDDGTLASNPHMLSGPGRLLAIDLDPAVDGTVRLQTQFLQVPSWHMRQLASRAVVRTGLRRGELARDHEPREHDAAAGVSAAASRRSHRPSRADGVRRRAPVGARSALAHAHRACRRGFAVHLRGEELVQPADHDVGHPVYDPEPSADHPRGRLIDTHLVPRALDLGASESARHSR